MTEPKRSTRRTATKAAQRSDSSDMSDSIAPKRRKVMRKSRKTFDNERGLPQPALPMEVWEIILDYLYPSQLAHVAAASPAMHAIVSAMSIWQTIHETASLPQLTKSGLRSTCYGSVIKVSNKICEVCYALCAVDGCDAALPVHFPSQKKCIHLCLQCRKDHYRCHPEPGYVFERYACGGQVGVDAQRTKERRAEEKKMKKRKEDHDRRRKELHEALANIELALDEKNELCKRYITQGKPKLAEAVSNIDVDIKHKKQMDERREELKAAIKGLGVKIENNKNLTDNYIENGGDLGRVVRIMVERKWYSEQTTYDTDRVYEVKAAYGRRFTKFDNNLGREEAVRKFVLERIKLGKWNDISSDPVTPDRPPKSLWAHINERSVGVWSRYLREALSEGLVNDECKQEAVRVDPDSPNDLSADLCVKAVEFGAEALVRKHIALLTQNAEHAKQVSQGYKPSMLRRMYPKGLPVAPTYQQPECTFTSAAKRVLGEEKFMEALLADRNIALRSVKAAYIREKRSAIPSGLAEFVNEFNNHDPHLTNSMFYYRRDKFIRNQLPRIAEQQNVHWKYMSELLNDLKWQGYIKTRRTEKKMIGFT